MGNALQDGSVDRRVPVDVICQHSKDGHIIPIKVRLVNEDGELQTFQIRGYRHRSGGEKFVLPSGIPVAGRFVYEFECKIAVFGVEKQIYLIYNVYDNIWRMI